MAKSESTVNRYIIPLIFLSSDEIDGASSLCYNLRRGLHCEVYEWSFSNGTDSPMSRMQYTDKNGEVRVVMAYMDDPRWVFYQSGKLLPFEDESNYSRRFIKKRLNFDIQKQYLSRMGISLSNIDENVTFCKTLKRVAWGKDDIFDEDSWVDPFADDSRVCQNEAGDLTTK